MFLGFFFTPRQSMGLLHFFFKCFTSSPFHLGLIWTWPFVRGFRFSTTKLCFSVSCLDAFSRPLSTQNTEKVFTAKSYFPPHLDRLETYLFMTALFIHESYFIFNSTQGVFSRARILLLFFKLTLLGGKWGVCGFVIADM